MHSCPAASCLLQAKVSVLDPTGGREGYVTSVSVSKNCLSVLKWNCTTYSIFNLMCSIVESSGVLGGTSSSGLGRPGRKRRGDVDLQLS